jgi:hypothetical protein
MDPNKPPYAEPSRIKGWILVGLFCFPTVFALVQISRAIFFGVVYHYGKGRGGDVIFQWGDPNSMVTLFWYIVMALFVPVGISVGLWATRHDKHGG